MSELDRYRTALEQIATGEIVGEPNNARDTLAICRDIAREALRQPLLAGDSDTESKDGK